MIWNYYIFQSQKYIKVIMERFKFIGWKVEVVCVTKMWVYD